MSRRVLFLGFLLASLVSAIAAPPAWWALRSVTDANPPNDDAAVNQGQLKQFTQKAVQELNARVPGGAGEELNSLVAGWVQAYQNGNYNATNPLPADFEAMTSGQLKWIANKIHARLVFAKYENAPPAWLVPNPATDKQLVNLGQLKTVFNFDLTAPTGQLPDWWQRFYFEGETGIDPDGDNDWDELTNIEEYANQLDPLDWDTDEDDLPDAWEIANNLNALDDGSINPDNGWFGDPDFDTLSNIEEFWYGINPRNPDTDSDGLTDYEEIYLTNTFPEDIDSDNDSIPDGAEDPDRDGLSNLEELRTHHTQPRNADSDYDALRDGWEITNGLNPLVYNSITDPDGDGLTNVQEQRLGLAPLNSDTDDDEIPDGDEDPDGDGLTNFNELNIHYTDPLKIDTDNDGLTDDAEINTHLTNPKKYDTDGDGIPDSWEILNFFNAKDPTGPNGQSADFDNDGLSNFKEWLNGSNPRDSDSDDDGIDDLAEVSQGTDPNDPNDPPEDGSPPVDEVQEVPFHVLGDYASWRMEIRGEGPRDHRTISVVSPAPGVPETGIIKLRRNNKYQVTLHHTGSKEDEEDTWYCWEAFADDKPTEQTFPSYEPDRIPGAALFFTIGSGHWLVDNRDGLFTTHNHRYEGEGGNAAAGLSATLLPMETVVGDAEDIQDASEGFVAAEAVPRPSVEMTVVSSTLQDGDLHIDLEGTVRDSVSRFAQSATERPQTLNFYHQDELLHSIPIDATVGDGFEFDETVVIPDALPEAYVIRAETTENIAGNKAFDESSVSLTWEQDPAAFPTLSSPLSIAFGAAPTPSVVDQATLFVGSGAPQSGDTASVESAADSLTFTGNLLIPATPANLTAPCRLEIEYPEGFSSTQIDSVFVKLELAAPGFPKNKIVGRWIETGVGTRIFRPGDRILGNVALKNSETSHQDLRGTPPSAIEASTVRFPSFPAELAAAGLQLVSGGIAYDLINKGGTWYPEDPDEAGEIKLFLPSAHLVPGRLQAPGYDSDEGLLNFQLRYPETSDIEATEILIVPGAESSSNPPPPQAAARTYSLSTASSTTPPPWQPGNPVIPEHIIWAYRFLNASDEFAEELLNGYLRGGHQIATGDFFRDLSTQVNWGNDRTTSDDNIRTISIEEDVNPIHAARLLFEGLKEMYLYDEVADDFIWEESYNEIVAFQAAAAIAVQKTQQTAVAATELYLSGLGIVNEGLDWILVVNDVAEGHFESLAAALPGISAGLVKAGGHFTIVTMAGRQLDHFDYVGFHGLREFGINGNLTTAGTVYDEYGYSVFLRDVFSCHAGRIDPPETHGDLKRAMIDMEDSYPRPRNGVFDAHHDFPWARRKWFADHGINVNDPAYGRWIRKDRHGEWHGWAGGEFNAWWNQWIAEESTDQPYTMQQIFQKLADCRQRFQDTQ